MPTDALVVLVTVGSDAEARQLAQTLLDQKLIACANLFAVQSLYRWEGQIQDDAEVLMILKTTRAVFETQLVPAIQAAHSYDVPEIIAVPIVLGAANYLNWMAGEVRG